MRNTNHLSINHRVNIEKGLQMQNYSLTVCLLSITQFIVGGVEEPFVKRCWFRQNIDLFT